ncbi:hypothetical protein [Nesterenkonia lutea]|uniref:D-alanine-D-alanine ligase-like ATP-grasp enzyme n=1 Tax=Nesterenkonia lutea TaxID=272919 RepID=A0ABR9JBU0_9MICC|nr:hypothetical protein [Nesterenkonia lutea]MBE1523403.1 D-alanine-D-alanine ligase-like ATP-grasp enzyme [Nesterenkonia lutea]
MELALASPESDLTAVNARFVKDHLVSRWKDFEDSAEYVHASERIRRVAASRGLEVIQGPGVSLFLQGDECVGGLVGTQPSISTGLATKICASKGLTKELLLRAGLPTPAFRLISRNNIESAREYVRSRPKDALVVKPLDGNQGKGITTGLRTPSALDAAWERAKNATKAEMILIEDEVAGVDVRVSVVNGVAIAAAARIPPFVVGNGTATLAELTAELLTARTRHSYLRRLKLLPDPEYLRRATASQETVLLPNQVQFLNGTANLSQGGVPVDITDTIPAEILRLAERVTKAIPELGYAGVDVLMPDVTSTAGAMVIEVNTSANPLVHDLPVFGQCRHVCDAMVGEIIRRAQP